MPQFSFIFTWFTTYFERILSPTTNEMKIWSLKKSFFVGNEMINAYPVLILNQCNVFHMRNVTQDTRDIFQNILVSCIQENVKLAGMIHHKKISGETKTSEQTSGKTAGRMSGKTSGRTSDNPLRICLNKRLGKHLLWRLKKRPGKPLNYFSGV